jgi:O-antigen/teichoic acid export membrane protein
MQKKFVQNLLFLLILNLLIKPFWLLGIDRAVQNSVGNQEYGFYWALFNFSYIFQIFLDFGINSFNNRNIAQHHQLLSKYFSSIIVLKLLLTLFYIVLLFTVGLFIGYSDRAIKLLGFLAFNQIIASYILYLRSNISALQYFKTDSVFSVLDRSFMIIMCSIALWGNVLHQTFKIEWFVYIQTISYCITALLAFLFVYNKTLYFKFRFNKALFLLILKKSYPFAILSLLMSVYTRIDGVMIERLLPDPVGKIQTGIYSQSYRVLDALNMIAFLFATLLLPIFSRMLKTKEDIRDLATTSFRIFFFPATIIITACFVYSEEIMVLLYHHNDEYSARIFRFLILNFLSMGSVYIFGTLLTANANLSFLNITSAIGMGLNILLNFVLISRYQAFGAVIATLLTQFLVSSIQVLKAVKLFKIQVLAKTIFLSLIFLTILILSAYFIRQAYIDWYWGFFSVLLIGGIMVFTFRLIQIKTLIRSILP